MEETMYYSEDLIEEVRMKNDIVDVISGYVRLQKKGSSYFGLCQQIQADVLLFWLRRRRKCIYVSHGI